LTACVAGLVSAQLLAATPAAAPDPWTRVPALPTGCFASQDTWWDRNNAAIDSVQQDHYRQNDVNSAIEQNFVQAQEENPMAMAQAMQQGQQTQTEIPAQQAKEKQLDDEGKRNVLRTAGSAALLRGRGLRCA
jgi:hypothetical protein